jgi:bifunctional DNA-binding transcriptional regulator/antitoxin component of YhaV-PrlF toxin-antitoxin module
MPETLISVTKAYETGKPDSLIVIVPTEARKLLSIRKGQRFAVKIDSARRLVYEPLDNKDEKKEAPQK